MGFPRAPGLCAVAESAVKCQSLLANAGGCVETHQSMCLWHRGDGRGCTWNGMDGLCHGPMALDFLNVLCILKRGKQWGRTIKSSKIPNHHHSSVLLILLTHLYYRNTAQSFSGWGSYLQALTRAGFHRHKMAADGADLLGILPQERAMFLECCQICPNLMEKVSSAFRRHWGLTRSRFSSVLCSG